MKEVGAMTFEDDLAAANETKWVDVDVVLNGNLHTFRFLQFAGLDWATEADKHPARPGVLIDMKYGYNIRTLCKAVAKITGRRVSEDGSLAVLPEAQWDILFRDSSGNAAQALCDAIWGLNEALPEAEVDAAKKLRADLASARTSPSPSDSESPQDASGAGNPPKKRRTSTTKPGA